MQIPPKSEDVFLSDSYIPLCISLWMPIFLKVFILDALAGYTPRDEREAQNICERISPRLAHANAAVVLSTVKVSRKLLILIKKLY